MIVLLSGVRLIVVFDRFVYQVHVGRQWKEIYPVEDVIKVLQPVSKHADYLKVDEVECEAQDADAHRNFFNTICLISRVRIFDDIDREVN